MYLGSYQHQIDDKGRLSLPAPFRDRSGADEGMVLVHAFPDCLTLYPLATWADVVTRLRERLRLEPEARPWVLRITSNAQEVSPDKQGRILVPQRLQEAVGISGAATVVGNIDRVEIWDPDRFAGMSDDIPEADASRLRHQIFG